MKNQLPSTLRVIMLREASKVERCHTLPHHGSYTDGQHSYDAVMLYLALCPAPSFEVVKAILGHDLGERWCGDLPAPAKWSDADLQTRHEALENRCLRHLGFEMTLSPEDWNWFKAMDIVEFWLWCQDQLSLGNQHAGIILLRLDAYFKRAVLPGPVAAFINDYEWTRTSDEIPK